MQRHTSLLPINVDPYIRLFERSPFEVLLVASTLYIPSLALLTAGLLFATLEAFRFARYTAC